MLKTSFKRIISIILTLALICSLAVGIAAFSSSAEENTFFIGDVKSVKTSSGAFLQAYISIEKGTSTDVSFFAADKYDVYGFEANSGGDTIDVKKSSNETSMGAADGNDCYSTWTTDPKSVPYQAYEVDVTGKSGEMIIGFQGRTENAKGELVMQIYDPSEGKYFEVDRKTVVGLDTITLSYTVDAQKYAENGRLRYRITMPSGSTDKWIYMTAAAAGMIRKDIQYGTTKTRTSPGNASYNYRGETTDDMAFIVEAVNENGVARSMPIYFVSRGSQMQNKLHHFVANFGADTTSRNMTWTTEEDMPTFVQVIPYGPLEPDFTNATVFEGVTEYHKSNFVKNYEHYVTVSGLEEGKEYWYRYGDGSAVWSAPCYMKMDDGDASFSFIVGGDPQPEQPSATEEEAEEKMGKRYVEMMYSVNEAIRMTGAEFIVNCGDSTDSGDIELCWDWYFKSNLPMFRSTTLASTMGNHDSWGYNYWLRKHNYPDLSGDEGGHGSYYSFDYGNAHFVVLNGNIAPSNGRTVLTEKFLAWLEEDLAKTDKEFKIAVSHQGMYSYPVHTYDKETVEMRPLVVALFDKYNLDIMFQGHDHVWIRTNTMEGGKKTVNTDTVVDIVNGERLTYFVDPDGTTYTNAGSFTGSKYHDPNPSKFTSLISVACASQPKLPTFTTVEIENGKLVLRGWAREKDGTCKRISEYTCYGDTKSDGFNILKTSFYDKVEERINALPEDITLENKGEVAELKAICDVESETIIGKYIPSYAKLSAAAEKIEELERENAVPEITVGELVSEWETGKELILPTASAYDENDGEVNVTLSITCGEEKVEISGNSVVFDKPGTYTFTYTAIDSDEHVTEVIYMVEVVLGTKKGDMDGDGEITVSDALAALRIAARLAECTDKDLLIGDIDADGEITVSDALAILRVAAKMADEL